MSKKRKSGSRVDAPTQSIELLHRAVDRRLWWSSIVLGAVALCSQVCALAVLSSPRPVVAFDATGRPLVFRATYEAAVPDEHRVRAFVLDFLDQYVGVDGHGFDAKMLDALMMMTEEMRREVVTSEGYQSFKRQYRGEDITSRFEDASVEVAPFDAKDRHGAVYAAVIARQEFDATIGKLDDPPQPWIFMHLRIRRTPVTADWRYGMLVEAAEFTFRDSLSEAEMAKMEALGR